MGKSFESAVFNRKWREAILQTWNQKLQRKITSIRNKILKRFGIKNNGFVLWEGASPMTGEPIVAIVTAVRAASKNAKTGWMHQLWILRSDIPPHEAFKQGLDAAP